MEAIGLGCFWFARRDFKHEGEANNFSPQAYLVEIRKTLEGVDSISNVKLKGKALRILYSAA